MRLLILNTMSLPTPPGADPRDDIARLQAELGGDAPFTYVDVQQQDMRDAALARWPFLVAIRRYRTQAAMPAPRAS